MVMVQTMVVFVPVVVVVFVFVMMFVCHDLFVFSICKITNFLFNGTLTIVGD